MASFQADLSPSMIKGSDEDQLLSNLALRAAPLANGILDLLLLERKSNRLMVEAAQPGR